MSRLAKHLAELRRSLRPGDLAVLALGVCALGLSLKLNSQSGIAEKVVIRAGGQVVAELDPRLTRQIAVSGPLGETQVEVGGGRARIAADPSPRQLCVKQGWLDTAGELAVCLPNQVSVELVGRSRRYDSLAY